MAKAVKRRKSVEIYFVLYLVALVLLMPDSKDASLRPGTDALAPVRIELFPEKIRLECAIQRDSSGPVKILSADSINIIRFSPALNTMRVRATIEDVENGQMLTIDDSLPQQSTFASVKVSPERGIISFRWSPLLASFSSRTFRVTLQVSGVPIAQDDEQAQAVGQTQFVLTTIVNNQQPPQVIVLGGRVDTLVMRDTAMSRQFTESLSSEFWIEPARTMIMAAAGKEWNNRITIGGADPARDLQSLPTVRVVGGAQIELSRYIEQRTLIVKGKAPVNGNSVIEVLATRTDGKQTRQTFTVQTVTTAIPRVPEIAYPGVEIVIDPLLPSVESARAVITDGSRELSSSSSGLVRYKPLILDTGKVLVFERTIDGQTDYSSNIYVRAFPSPIIREVRRGNDPDTKTISVQFFGQDRTANRPSLKIIDGNIASLRKLAGNLRPADNQKPVVSWIEVFEVTRKDPNRPFVFRVQAYDERGRQSQIFSED